MASIALAAVSAESLVSFADDEQSPLQSVDLHAHPFMDMGMGRIIFTGNFGSGLKAKDYKALFSSQINPDALEHSGDGLVVVSLYAHPVLKFPARSAIRAQIRKAEAFVAAHPNWVIAHTPAEARAAGSQGKRVIVLALERASDVIASESDAKEFIDDLGVRIVTVLHLSDDSNGGVAVFKGPKEMLNPGSIFHSIKDKDNVLVNRKGLSRKGDALIRLLLAHHAWIDLAHASDQSFDAIAALLGQAGQPLLCTHTALRRHLPAERALSDAQLEAIRASGGIVGLLPSEEMLGHTPVDSRFCPSSCSCDGSVAAFATQYAELVEKLGPGSVMLGSDFNGGIEHLKPACQTRSSLDGKQGLWNIGQTSELWESAARLGAPVPTGRVMVEGFLDAWDRAYKAVVPPEAAPPVHRSGD